MTHVDVGFDHANPIYDTQSSTCAMAPIPMPGIARDTGHLDLLSHPAVYRRTREWLKSERR
jgi:hypothetical protein